MTIKILNLYAGIGGNRKLWKGDIEVTAVENNPKIAKAYSDFFPDDKIVVGDAHQYLLENFDKFDFIWSSPPCQSHSRIRLTVISRGDAKPTFPDMKLYEEIIFLNKFFKSKWVVENVVGYYKPLIKPQEVGKHYIWSNFIIGKVKKESRKHNAPINILEKRKGFNTKGYNFGHRKDQILMNCVEPELGLHIFNMAFKEPQTTLDIPKVQLKERGGA